MISTEPGGSRPTTCAGQALVFPQSLQLAVLLVEAGGISRCTNMYPTLPSVKRHLRQIARAAGCSSVSLTLLTIWACGGRTAEDASHAVGGAGGSSSNGGATAVATATPEECDNYFARIAEAVQTQVPCFDGVFFYEMNGTLNAYAFYSWLGDCDAGVILGDSLRTSAQNIAKAIPDRPTGGCGRLGTVTSALDRIDELYIAAKACGWDGWTSAFVVTLDASGLVVSVTPGPHAQLSEEGLACLQEALAGLTFSCFPNGRLCPHEFPYD